LRRDGEKGVKEKEREISTRFLFFSLNLSGSRTLSFGLRKLQDQVRKEQTSEK
jgi:hypothetical protein